MKVCFYSQITGLIRQLSVVGDMSEAQKLLEDGESVIEIDSRIDDDHLYWVYGGVLRLRPRCPVEVEGQVLKGVRPGSIVVIEGSEYTSTDGGDVTIQFDHAGVYHVQIKRWPYLDGEYQVDYSS